MCDLNVPHLIIELHAAVVFPEIAIVGKATYIASSNPDFVSTKAYCQRYQKKSENIRTCRERKISHGISIHSQSPIGWGTDKAIAKMRWHMGTIDAIVALVGQKI